MPEYIDKNTFTNLKAERRYRVDRPKDLTKYLQAGVNIVQI